MARIVDAIEAHGRFMAAHPNAQIEAPIARAPVPSPPPIPDPEPAFNMFLICPMPAISTESDAQRQFYRVGIPQYRIIPPKSL